MLPLFMQCEALSAFWYPCGLKFESIHKKKIVCSVITSVIILSSRSRIAELWHKMKSRKLEFSNADFVFLKYCIACLFLMF